MRIIFVPQYPTHLRYQEWWIYKIPEEFRKAGHEVITLGEGYAENIEYNHTQNGMFSPIDAAIDFETEQIKEYMELELKKDDVLFLADLSFPGIFYNVLFHKQPSKVYAFCHATSINLYDYFADQKLFKFPIESIHALKCNKVFVGSQYHKDKLRWDNTVVTYLPFPPITPPPVTEKVYDIMSASRPTKQKVDNDLEQLVASEFGQVNRPLATTWDDYFQNLSMSKVLLITAHEDTFGYQIIDAILNGCIPIARNNLAYPEILDREYLYNDENELLQKIDMALSGKLKVPTIKCKDGMDNFYNKLLKEMEE